VHGPSQFLLSSLIASLNSMSIRNLLYRVAPLFQPKVRKKKPRQVIPITKVLRKHRCGLWLASSYCVVMLVTWTVTCVLCYKPINFATYHDHQGVYNKRQYEVNEWARRLAKTLMSLLGAVSIPISSSVCAKFAAVYCQMHSHNRHQSLTMRQTLALADKGWSDLRILSHLVRPIEGRRTRSPALSISVLVCTLG